MVTRKSKILKNVHETAKGLHAIGVMDKITMRKFDALCIPEVRALTPKQITAIRTRSGASQAVFAKCLNTSASSVRQWEQGKKQPKGTSLKLLNIVEKNGLEILMA